MRIGQTSVVHFGSQLIASVAGFVATVYIAQELGGAVLGSYALFAAVLIWLKTGVGAGTQQTIAKRLSEIGESGPVLSAALLVQLFIFIFVSMLVLLFHNWVDSYLGFQGTGLLIIGLLALLLFSTVKAILRGEQKVHLAAVLSPLDRVIRSGVQLAVVFVGLLGGGIAGLVWGYIAGGAVASLAGLAMISSRLRRPTREDFRNVTSFSRYAWLSGIEERAFSALDTVVLGLFVGANLIGYYEVAWNLASLLAIFGDSVTKSLFPAISELGSRENRLEAGNLITDGMTYVGLFLIPGLVGVIFIGEHVLAIYGSEFTSATTVLPLLVLARLIYAYEAQLVTSINALDFPNIAFRVNLVFVGCNIALNVVLVWLYGWIGAAIATTVAAAVGLVAAYIALQRLVSFEIPLSEYLRQWGAAGTMGGVVFFIESTVVAIVPLVILQALTLVIIGAAVYFLSLIGLSGQFRETIRDNAPV
ncbi:oligosaccharide flippase family protein [Haloarcula nitratireducens]|uniref:Oligosaccharide flippase family protein n=1 Tax=Haloarcula nitratireducens TaxID=2487749 RepID=A0AAW4P7X8_9EURY|nr:oligosaccharide flippase family protein [Halomicroarcula nitratireducens]MBX0294017.1 oligosaccharide flippase family protein [Halomicroarcula nitratireducens]